MLEDLEEAVRKSVGSGGAVRVEFGGDLYNATEQPETGLGELLGLVSAVLVLLLAFGSVVAMGLPIGLALFGLTLGIGGIIGLVAIGMDVPEWTPNMASMIGLGVGIDYVVHRHRFREGLADGLTVDDAAGRATQPLGRNFRRRTVIVILGLAMAGILSATAAAVAVSIVVGLTVIASLTILPALLGWPPVNPKISGAVTTQRDESGRWRVGAPPNMRGLTCITLALPC